MPNLLEYKRVTKSHLILIVVITIILFVVFTFVYKSITIARLVTVYSGLNLLYMYSLDKKVKASISLPIYFILLTGLFITLFFELSNLSMPLALNLIIVITIYILIVLGGVHLIKIPPYVVDGKYDIDDAKKYIKKLDIKMLKILLLVTAVLFLILLILTIILNLWRNSLI